MNWVTIGLDCGLLITGGKSFSKGFPKQKQLRARVLIFSRNSITMLLQRTYPPTPPPTHPHPRHTHTNTHTRTHAHARAPHSDDKIGSMTTFNMREDTKKTINIDASANT